ncbi:AAA family ATPase [Colletotrichum musicola]|uniref:AAA family ATPase n=1 Tax=Colletotrichum musicola TaxID=2175873 RepID=A0A8H6MUS5_9PEZI|nr:AAA family ATPase [Colletotrichum musicola]
MPPEVVQVIPRAETPVPTGDNAKIGKTDCDSERITAPEPGTEVISKPEQARQPQNVTVEDLFSAASGYLKVVSNISAPEDVGTEEYETGRSAVNYRNPPLFKEIFDNEKQQDTLRLRSHQAFLHHTLADYRIEELEKELKKLKNIVHGREEDWEPPRWKFPVYRHEKDTFTADRFRANLQTVLLPTKQQAALEVLITEHVDFSSVPKLGTGTDVHSDDPKPERQQRAERVRIRSRVLLYHLDKVIGGHLTNLGGANRVEDKMVYSPLVFLRPFKYFVKSFGEIKQSLAALRAQAETEMSEEIGSSRHDKWKKKNPSSFDNKTFDDKDLEKDLALLVDFLEGDLQPTMQLCKQIVDGTATTIEYGDLWHLFERDDVVVTSKDQHHAFRVVSIAGGREPLIWTTRLAGDEKPVRVHGFVVDCISMGTNGSSYLPKLHKITIKKFYGRQPVTDLPVYPLKFDPNATVLRAKFLAGGRRFLDITRNTFCHKMVTGKTLDEPSHELESRAIIDMTLATAMKPEWRLKPSISTDDFTKPDKRETINSQAQWCIHSGEGCCGGDVIHKDLEIDEMKAQSFNKKEAQSFGPLREEDLSDEDLMLMHHYVYAFVLRSRQWVTVLTEDLHDVVFENSFDDLVLPDSHGATVRALVETHENSRASPRSSSSQPTMNIGSALDIVKGKGAGLIILLHGPPGVGKTSTAECVADDTKRPLFPITCGDIGETAAEVERNLQYNFRLADKWGCVLLLDEADVFLAKRTRNDLRHNAVTSVFLRSLEYYAGILFLTTNRVGAIDPAFKSRIQMSLFYSKLDLRVTKELYRKFIKRAKAEQDRTGNHAFEIRKAEILKFAKDHFKELTRKNRDTWNGRQIRNAFQTAIALTEHQGKTSKPGDALPVLGEMQFRMVASGFEKFDEYLIQTLGFTEAAAAKREGMRDDAFSTALAYQPMETPRHAYARQAVPRYHPSLSDDSDSEPDSDEDEDEDEDEDDDDKKKKRGKGAALKRADTGLAATPAAESANFKQYQEYQEWLKWKEQNR